MGKERKAQRGRILSFRLIIRIHHFWGHIDFPYSYSMARQRIIGSLLPPPCYLTPRSTSALMNTYSSTGTCVGMLLLSLLSLLLLLLLLL